tara:strand:+ start:46 stop:1047 length:1002 start_codon:yes stop_codon:yes gene_type:complete
MTEIKKIASKVLLLIVGLIALNFVYKATLWQSDLNTYSRVDEALKTAKNANILYLGDCSDSYFGPERDHEKGISQLLDSLLPNKTVATISEIGFHAGMFAGILNNLPKNTNVNTVVVTMNLRAFSANILYAFSANAIQQRTIMLKERPPLVNRFLLTFKPTNIYHGPGLESQILTQQKTNKIPLAPYNSLYDWQTAFKNGEYINFDASWTDDKKAKALGHIRNYAYQINLEQNPRITDFDEIVLNAKKKNIRLIFHILPENIKLTNKLIGKDLTDIINYNQRLLHQRYSSENVTIIDNMELLDGIDFIETLPNSHFYYNGRKKMAKEIAKLIK